MIRTIIKAEIKNMTRDRMYIFFFLFPFILGGAGYLLVDYVREQNPGNTIWPAIISMFLILMTGYIFGAVVAFTLLDDKDDSVLMSLKITPISVKAYVTVKLVVGALFGFFATLILVFATNFLPDATVWTILVVAILASLQAPSLALIVNSFSSNKVEGFVVMKMSGLILMLPIATYFIVGAIQYVFGIAPGFWAARIIEMETTFDTEGSILLIFILGVAYNLFFSWLFMKLYTKRSNI